MAEIVLGVLRLANELGKCIVVPIERQFSYLCCFNRNVQSLNDEAKKLGDERAGLDMDVTTAKNDGRDIDPKVDSWLKEVNEIQQKMNALETEITSIQGGGCLYMKSHYSISKRAIKITEAMKLKREDRRDISVISHHRPPPTSMVLDILERPTSEFESRKEIEEDIMAILRDEKVKVMGICGMGGIGKTTLAKKVMSKVREQKLFDKSVMAVVSQHVDKEKIQGEMAENLGLELKEKSLSSRAKILCSRLMNGERILIVLDDVWECLKLEELGIPDKDGCSILLTSRDRGVLARMDVNPILEMKTLTEEEALSFFKEKLGFCANDQNWLSTLVQEISKECKGLPLALASVAAALKDKKDAISIWKDALHQLKSSNPRDLSEVLKDVYTPIKLSYDYLSSLNARFIFLLCCIFPEDSNITLDNLAAYAMGLRLFDGIRELEKVRNRTYSLVNMLKSRFLLLEGKDERHVRMHDVVRDVAIFIASNEKQLIKHDDTSTWISPFLGERIKLAKGLTFPNLRLFMVDESALEEFQSSGICFEGMNELNVLSIMAPSLRSLPDTTRCLKNLRTLILQRCSSLMTLCFVGELENLEILICRDCDNVEELPSETARLKRLKLLEISECEAVEKIGPGVISSLDKLEELKIVSSFDKWEAHDDKENENMGLHELESLPNLTSLEIEVTDYNLAAQQVSLPRKIEKYHIAVGDTYQGYGYEFGKTMSFQLPEEITLGNWIHEYVANAECLILSGDGSNCVDLGVAQKNIRFLDFRSCTTASSLVRGCGATIVFPLMETMLLFGLGNLEEIWDIDGPISEISSSSSCSYSFKNLKELTLVNLPALKRLWKTSPNVVSLYTNLSSIFVSNCPRLLNLSPLSTSKDCFPQLQSICIESCDMMEHVFSWNEDESRLITIKFPKLERLQLCDLPNLRVIYQGIENTESPLLTQIGIKGCPQLISHSLQLLQKEKLMTYANLRELPLLAHAKIMNTFSPQIPIGSFAQLEHLKIENLGNIKSLFSFSIAQGLDSLKILRIEDCRKMVKVIEEDEEERLHEITLLFPHLESLFLHDLPKLKTFCNWRHGLELPKLVGLCIHGCSEMTSFNLGSLTTPSLKSLEQLHICDCTMMEQVFLWSEQEKGKEIIGQISRDHHHITFPRLKILNLSKLPRLTNFYKGIDSITLPLLTEMKMFRCPNMEGVVSATTSSSGDINNKVVGKLKEQTIYCLLLIWNQFPIDNFTRLEELSIESFDKISFLFSTSIADNLINLKELTIKSCKNLVKVIGEEIDESHETSLLFPQLEKLSLDELPKLKIFCEWRCALELPSLEEIRIYRCRETERFSLGSLSTPNLNNIYPELDDITITGDLNDALQQRFSIKGESTSSEGEEDREDKDETEEEESTSSELSVGQEEKEKGEIEEQEEESTPSEENEA